MCQPCCRHKDTALKKADEITALTELRFQTSWESTKHINQLTSHRNKFPNPLSQVNSSPSLPPHHAAIFSGGKLGASSTCRG